MQAHKAIYIGRMSHARGHAIKAWCNTQTITALSTAEAELCAGVKACAEGLGLMLMLKDLGRIVVTHMLCDASAQQHESVVDAERKVCRANLAAHLSSKVTITNTTWRTFSSKFDEQVDEWTVTEVGCPCYFDREARENMCACCQKDAVSCGAERSHRCVPRGRGDLCALEDDKRPTAARCRTMRVTSTVTTPLQRTGKVAASVSYCRDRISSHSHLVLRPPRPPRPSRPGHRWRPGLLLG